MMLKEVGLNMSVRQARIVSITQQSDEFSTNPDIDVVKLEPINCSEEEFFDWYVYLQTFDERFGNCTTDSIIYVDEYCPFKVGDVITLSFSDYLTRKIEIAAIRAQSEIFKRFQACKSAVNAAA